MKTSLVLWFSSTSALENCNRRSNDGVARSRRRSERRAAWLATPSAGSLSSSNCRAAKRGAHNMHPQSRTATELMELEQKYWNAIRDRDGETAASLSDDPCLVVGAS